MAVDPNPKGQPKKETAKDSPGFLKWLVDSYNGLFKLLIQPQLPKSRMMLIMAVCFVTGMVWAYIINPTTFHSAAPHQLGPNSQEQWLKLVAGAGTEIRVYAPEDIQRLLNQVENPAAQLDNLIAAEQTAEISRNVLPALQEIRPYADGVAGTDSPSSGSFIMEIVMFFVAIVVFLLLANVFAALWGLLIGGLVSDAIRAIKPKTEAQKLMAKEREAMKQQRQLEEKMKQEMAREAAASDLGPAVMQRVSIYTKGRGYDDSFAIEDANDMFLGECGATIAKTVGDSQELSAIEVWLFDKEDFVRTITKVFASEHAYNDPAIRSELDTRVENPAADIVVLRPGAVLELQSKALLVQAKVAEAVPGNTPGLPANSHFQELRIQMQAWQTEGHPVTQFAAPPVPPPSSGLPDLSSYEVGPPPPVPSQGPSATQFDYSPSPTQPSYPAPQPPPPSGGLPDLSSYEIGPPPSMPGYNDQTANDEDDPFAGTGDFTPLGN
jgi:hypothetical protein